MADLIERLDELYRAATPGPWKASPCKTVSGVLWDVEAAHDDGRWSHGLNPLHVRFERENAEFFVALVNAWPAISKALEATQAFLTANDEANRLASLLSAKDDVLEVLGEPKPGMGAVVNSALHSSDCRDDLREALAALTGKEPE